jgi:hypothetical protein
MGSGVVLTAPDTALPWSVFGGGGGSASSPSYALGATAGQPAIGESQSTNLRLGAGYWYGACADPDGDGVTSCPPVDNCPAYPSFWTVPSGDTDCDGFASADETLITTDSGDPCGFTPGAPGESETWPPDLVETNGINISDVLAMKPVFGMAGPPRYNIVPAGTINISDVLALKPFFGKSCTP